LARIPGTCRQDVAGEQQVGEAAKPVNCPEAIALSGLRIKALSHLAIHSLPLRGVRV